jgi:hypothetical protein
MLEIEMFTLRFSENDISYWADRNTSQDYLIFQNDIGPAAHERGYLTQSDFLKTCEWKTPRSKSRCAKNTADLIREITQISFSASQEQLRIQVLTLLFGVGFPTASVILHFCSGKQYPILDFRALWSLNIEKYKVDDFALWWSYTEHCRTLAKRNNISMRTLDRALWQYSKENQKR